ncbi:dipicolinate synthase subunit A [Lachnospiraceae bacterium KM106-2]|nr:dipicolinate synthase subunit A [Lachnospiraceae bacterium KM106-2]
MSYLYDFAVIGGDNRQLFLADLLSKKNVKTCYYGLNPCALPSRYIPCFFNQTITASASLEEAIRSSKYIICPTPFSKDQTYVTTATTLGIPVDHLLEYTACDQVIYGGAIPKDVCEKGKDKGITLVDIMKFEHVSMLNAIATAEGAICEAISHSIINLQGSQVLLLGFGKCGQILAKKLSALDAHVTVTVRKEDVVAQAKAYGYDSFLLANLKEKVNQYEFIFNTIPSLVLTKDVLANVNFETAIIDIASSPGGVDFNYTNDHCYNANLYLGLPGKMSPKSSAKILLDAILNDCKL